MRPADKLIFAAVAKDLGLFILVRRTNSESLKYVGRAGYTPKPLDCKAKTADINTGRYKTAGLVVSPEIHPAAFNPSKLAGARNIWESYGKKMLESNRYSVEMDASSKHYGCVRLNGKCLHGDYDLYDIVDPKQARRNLGLVQKIDGMDHIRGPNFYKVQSAVNGQIQVNMVQHGYATQFAAHSDEFIDAFTPGGENFTINSLSEVRELYKNRFDGRITIENDDKRVGYASRV